MARGAAGDQAGPSARSYRLWHLRRKRRTAFELPQPRVYTSDPATPGQRSQRHIPHLLPRRKKTDFLITQPPLFLLRTAPSERLHLGWPPRQPQVRAAAHQDGLCACPPAAGARPCPRQQRPALRRRRCADAWLCPAPRLAAGSAARQVPGAAVAPPPRPCLRAEAARQQEPEERPWLPGAVGFGLVPLALPVCLSPFPAARSGAPGAKRREKKGRRGVDPPAA